jgi:hypothetical protein
MKKFDKKKAKELDALLDDLYRHGSVSIPLFGDGFSTNGRYSLAEDIAADGYANLCDNRHLMMFYEITPKGRSFCRAGGYVQLLRNARRRTIKTGIKFVISFILSVAAIIFANWIMK